MKRTFLFLYFLQSAATQQLVSNSFTAAALSPSGELN
jgi:hypothetical protein